ncbi:polysaccharide deacetylase family protein [Chryseobacterium indologenes]|uniref:polysaccharide deacetylase family protein n=1 Tax=Chryseobacterium indologenes TaxID=253 RepID=UPI000B5168E7|nr:polysaccharide deacetylase family protein [Chryseobacterium indologenes]ASE60424.1 polysaccharide deacetylase [Chryseobacterium indologenes]ATN04609.1 polysaccharide deacetylase [Chryseobacterium indologenes]AYY86639.1 polysaccharide deacetylase [Chryseobacterium indologenes]QIX83539.1 polysaccharide deacetylase family protein [Chryseobacterium indologenes]TLX24956.1 polysaccharide deacetylase [Chryseobacterium indologenes]
MILLTFNIIEIEAEVKNSFKITDEERLKITEENTKAILRILDIHDIKASFFVEVSLTGKLQNLIKAISSKGHEIAFYNKDSNLDDIENAKKNIQDLLEKQIRGIRQKDVKIPQERLKLLEFNYVSNIDNANILFPFKRLKRDTEITEEDGLSIVPESISPYSQLPYNDFTFQILPMKYYQNMMLETLQNEEFVLIYLNTWQFTDFKKYRFHIPFYRTLFSGRKMEDKLDALLSFINGKELAVSRMKDYIF